MPGLALYFVPIEALTPNQRHLLAFFTSTIIARPMPMTVSVLVSMTLLALTGTLSAAEALSGFGTTTVWLIFSALVCAYAVMHPSWDLGSPISLSAALATPP